LQPYLKGYAGEMLGWPAGAAAWGQQSMWATLWVDQNAKKALGR